METKLFKVEVGILLPKSDKEFKDYNKVYDHKHGYYDENIVLFNSNKKEDAMKYADGYVESGVNNTYAVIVETSRDFDEQNIRDIDATGWTDDFDVEDDPSDFLQSSVIYSVAKINNKIVKDFIE